MATDDAPILQYDPLPDPRTHIRLLEFVRLSETWTDSIQVHCRLSTWLLDKAPSYSAISYRWGHSSDRFILVNSMRKEVGQNCEYVLKQVKWYATNQRGRQRHLQYVWCDAICINQADDDEKGHQVAKMGDIYRGSKQVLACVGEHENGSEYLFRALQQNSTVLKVLAFYMKYDPWFWRRRKPEKQLRLLRAIQNVLERSLRPLPEYCVDKWLRSKKPTRWSMEEYVTLFLKREYFSRLWIYQELFLGKSIIALCGADSAPLLHFTIFREAGLGHYLNRLRRGNRHIVGGSDHAWRLLYAGARERSEPTSLTTLVGHALNLDCNDPRDKIYGMLGMVTWKTGQVPIHPDYNRDAFDLGLDVLEYDDHSGIHLFSFAQLVAVNLKLALCPTDRLCQARQQRRSSQLSCSASASMGNRAETQHRRIIDDHWHGFQVVNDGKKWYFPEGMKTVIQGLVSSDCSSQHMSDRPTFILPPGVRSKDWCLVYYPGHKLPQTIEKRQSETRKWCSCVLIAREHDSIAPGGDLSIVGHGLAEQSQRMNLTIDWFRWPQCAPEFQIHWNATDLLVLASSFERSFHFSELSANQISAYMSGRVCGQPGSSFARRKKDD